MYIGSCGRKVLGFELGSKADQWQIWHRMCRVILSTSGAQPRDFWFLCCSVVFCTNAGCGVSKRKTEHCLLTLHKVKSVTKLISHFQARTQLHSSTVWGVSFYIELVNIFLLLLSFMLTLMLISYLKQPKSIDESPQTQCVFVKLVSCLSRYFSSNWHKTA